MGSKINLKARIERHSRILLEQGKLSYKKNHKTVNYGYKGVVFTLIFLVPIYPVFASFVNDTTEYDFNRANIDESSIIMSSDFGDQEGTSGNNLIIQSKDSYLYINAPIDAERDVSGSTDVIEYTIQDGESIASIANRFKVSRETIYWANNFDSSHTLHPGDVIKIPPVSGLVYEVKSGDTLGAIAKKYDVDEEKIMRQNLLLSAADLKAGQTLIIPGAIKIEPKPVQAPVSTKTYTKANTTTGAGYGFAAEAASEYVNTSGSYKLVWRQPQHTFYWGNCTWYVGQYKNVNWGGNANQWLYNAKKKGHATGSYPTLGAIVTFNGTGYNPKYGHVGIVMEVTSKYIIISDMNYRKLGEVTTRKVPINDRAISGYIYVD